jgi:tRNA U34 5-methylaminomethyl-2-thiouridine-forming methyltransferase MnmC
VEIEQIITADGSHTLFVPTLDEHYHSVNGAVQEACHVYIEAGLNACTCHSRVGGNPLHVLEMGFGTGLNALLTALEAEKRNIHVLYTALEKFPLADNVVKLLNYSEINPDLFDKIHAAEWGKITLITPYFSLQKIHTDFNEYDFPDRHDVVYYDAFAPDKQPEVWSQELFNRIYSAMNPNGILTTYCAKGVIRRMLQQAGFTVERIPGPPGKREMLRAKR